MFPHTINPRLFKALCTPPHTSFHSPSAKLHHQFYKSPSGSPYNLIILHGLMGSSNNFRSIVRNANISNKANCYLLDLRNHGASEHRADMEIRDMAGDVVGFLRERNLGNLIVMGHSLGGKVAMAIATCFQEIHEGLKGVVILDIAPVDYYRDPVRKYPQIEDTLKMLKVLNEVKFEGKSYAELRKEIIAKCPSKDIGELVWTNIDHDKGGHRWRINLKAIVENYPKIITYVPPKSEMVYKGVVKVMRGSKSDYILEHHIPKFLEIFPSMRRETDEVVIKDSGHWIHFEKPYDFIKEVSTVLDFIKSKDQ